MGPRVARLPSVGCGVCRAPQFLRRRSRALPSEGFTATRAAFEHVTTIVMPHDAHPRTGVFSRTAHAPSSAAAWPLGTGEMPHLCRVTTYLTASSALRVELGLNYWCQPLLWRRNCASGQFIVAQFVPGARERCKRAAFHCESARPTHTITPPPSWVHAITQRARQPPNTQRKPRHMHGSDSMDPTAGNKRDEDCSCTRASSTAMRATHTRRGR